MKKLFVGNLPETTKEEDLEELFSEHGVVRSIRLTKDVFSGKCRGFGFIEMEGHEARAAMAALNGTTFGGNMLRVKEEQAQFNKGRRKGRR